MGDASEELCIRWTQLGAFYPFSRNHNNKGQRDQYPWSFEESMLIAARNAIRQKYTVMHYFYTKVFEVSLYGGTVVRPMFFEYPRRYCIFKDSIYVHDWLCLNSIPCLL